MSSPRTVRGADRPLLRARLVVPVVRPPVENGIVGVEGQRITLVDRWRAGSVPAGARVVDLGEVILFPGLINAHCHLDYTRMAGQIPAPGCFTDWIKAMVALKAAWSYSEFAQSWLAGATMLLRTGTTTVADIETVPELLPEVRQATPLRVVSFLEFIHLQGGPAARQLLGRALARWTELPHAEGRVGLSPHAPYSTTGDVLRWAVGEARARGWRLSIHLAESEDEFEMFRHGRGPLYQWLKAQRPTGDCGGGSPVRHLAGLGCLGDDVLAVHVNWLDSGDAELLARNRVHVVHCPRSHAYFHHRPFPRTELASAGINLCLGTDSLATVDQRPGLAPELSLISEMNLIARSMPVLTPLEILRMATVNGARALGRAGQLGEVSPGSLADLVAIPYAGRCQEALEGIVEHQGGVRASMIAGRWVIPPGGV